MATRTPTDKRGPAPIHGGPLHFRSPDRYGDSACDPGAKWSGSDGVKWSGSDGVKQVGPGGTTLSPQPPWATPIAVRARLKEFPNSARRGLGWTPDTPDLRDATLNQQAIGRRPGTTSRIPGKKDPLGARQQADVFKRAVESIKRHRASMPTRKDLRQFCSPIEDQGELGSCTAQATIGMVEYMERRAVGNHIDSSALFTYKTTRKLLGWTGDTGGYLRTAMKALVLFGALPNERWPYDIATFEAEPDAFLYAYASNYQALEYLRLDPLAAGGNEIIENVCGALATEYVSMFGFSVFSSLHGGPEIPYPLETESLQGGHAVLAVGYDDDHPVYYRDTAGGLRQYGTGALLIRNSWGEEWGDDGYGWLPYDYVHNRLASDFWTCLKQEWVEQFK